MTRTQQRRDQRLRAAIHARGLQVTPYGNAGGVLVAGPDVYILAAEIRYLDERDLEPCRATVDDRQQRGL